jgi:hypothetical protein
MIARVGLIACALVVAGAAQAAPPKIRTDAANAVPRCVTPKRLMAFLKTRNPNLDPRFADIASFYKKHGEAWRVRWDYAFFQMALETNFLTYRRGDGRWGDVDPRQNNFAGLGTTGGGVPGDSYPNVSTGVLAQIQHLVVYSGQRIEDPVGARTRLKQDDIILITMANKKGQTTFADLARRWAADRNYGKSIEWVATSFRDGFCKGPDPVEEAETAPRVKPAKPVRKAQELARASNLGGPEPALAQPDTPAPLVRTIWSAADASPPPAPTGNASSPSAAAQQAQKPRGADSVAPERKPQFDVAAAVPESPVFAEQVIQTGQSTPADPEPEDVVTLPSSSSEQAKSPAASDPQPARPIAFAYAAGLGSALAKPAAASASVSACKIGSASFGGKKVLLVRSGDTAAVRFTVLTVLEGFEKSMLDSYLKAHAPGGSSVGEFASRDAAFAKAKELCPSAAAAPKAEGASAG